MRRAKTYLLNGSWDFWLRCILVITLLMIGSVPRFAYAEDDGSAPTSNSNGDLPFALLPTISSPELLKGLIDKSEVNSNDSSSNEVFDYQGSYDGQIAVTGGYEQFYNVKRGSIAPNSVVALAKDEGTLLIADCMLKKVGDASDYVAAAAYGINAIVTAVGQSSYALLVNDELESQSVASPAIVAMNRAVVFAQNTSATTSNMDSSALFAAYDGTLIANEITAELSGELSPAVNVGAGNGYISVANSTFQTTGTNSPFASSDGRIELDNVQGSSDAAQIAWMRDSGVCLVHGSSLESSMADRDADDPEAYAIGLYREDAINLETLQENTVFQATDSALSSALETGSFFYLTNTRARILLSNTTLDFDDNNVRLLTATGNNKNNWGTQGANGVSATVTAKNQKLKGDIVVDSQSSVDLFLVEGSTWRGGALNLSGTQNSLISDKLNVSVDRDSSWIVTKRSTVTTLNLANGARLIDAFGKSVKIVDSNGFTLVDGASDISVTVTGGFSTTVKMTADNAFENFTIDRAPFDEAFGLTTTYGSNPSSVYSADELQVIEMTGVVRNWFRELP